MNEFVRDNINRNLMRRYANILIQKVASYGCSILRSIKHLCRQFIFRLLMISFIAGTTYAFEVGKTLLDYVGKQFGADARERLVAWEDLANTQVQPDPIETLKLVNLFFNQTKFISDQKHWGKEDYWATPVELLATNGGDCEDYSIAKYFTLKEMGFPIDQLKITYVKALSLNQAHMVLAYYKTPDSEPLILDNLIDEIKPASQRTDLIPVYSFNAEGLWLTRFESKKDKKIGTPDKLSNWLDLISRQKKLHK